VVRRLRFGARRCATFAAAIVRLRRPIMRRSSRASGPCPSHWFCCDWGGKIDLIFPQAFTAHVHSAVITKTRAARLLHSVALLIQSAIVRTCNGVVVSRGVASRPSTILKCCLIAETDSELQYIKDPKIRCRELFISDAQDLYNVSTLR
jgi:hypothetical protein